MESFLALLTDGFLFSLKGTSLGNFMQQGGLVLWWLAGVVFLTWTLVIERMLFLWFEFPKLRQKWVDAWMLREDHDSWFAVSIRDGWLASAKYSLNKNLRFIKVLVAICPMLGLLGTVTGMISVFDVMATQGSSSPELMASGISLATIPTMAGMVAALTGMFCHSRLSKICMTKQIKLEKSLRSRR
jgi:biopolymer transport protein ExbB